MEDIALTRTLKFAFDSFSSRLRKQPLVSIFLVCALIGVSMFIMLESFMMRTLGLGYMTLSLLLALIVIMESLEED